MKEYVYDNYHISISGRGNSLSAAGIQMQFALISFKAHV